MKREKYYLPFYVDADINYLYLFSLLELAEYDAVSKSYSIIKYKSQSDLCKFMGISSATLQRIITNPAYEKYFSCDTKQKEIVMKTSFSNSNKEKNPPFIMFTQDEISFLRERKDNLLCKYHAYIKFYCGFSSATGSVQDFTIKQFLSAIGYCSNSKSYENKILNYNKLLLEAGFISIKKYRDELGHTRNIYAYNDKKESKKQRPITPISFSNSKDGFVF